MGRDDEPDKFNELLPYGHPDRHDSQRTFTEPSSGPPTRVGIFNRFSTGLPRRTQELWLYLAQTAMHAEDAEAALAHLGEEVDRRAKFFARGRLADSLQPAMESVWDDIKAGRWKPV